MAHSYSLPATYADADTASETTNSVPMLQSLLERLRAMVPAGESEIETYIRAHGGTMTDELERDISRKFGGHAGI